MSSGQRFDRRCFAATVAVSGVGLSLAAAALVPRHALMRDRRPARSRVAILTADRYSDALEQPLYDGLRLFNLAVKGKAVLLKPNLVEYAADVAINTHPSLVGAAAVAFLRISAALLYSTYFGSSTAFLDFTFEGTAVVLDSTGKIYIGGQATANDMPARTPAQASFAGGNQFLYSTYLGGNQNEYGAHASGYVYVFGTTDSQDFPITPGACQSTNPGWVQNSASVVAGRVAPGLIAVIDGEFFGPAQIATMVVENNQVKNIAGETKVYFDGVAAPIVYALNFGSYSAVSCIVPWEVAGKTTTRIQVEYRNVKGNFITAPVASALPAFYTINQSGTGPGAFLNHPDYSLNSSSNAVVRGGWVFMYGTGGGVTSPAGVTASFTRYPPLYPLVGNVTVTIGGRTLPASDVVAFSAPDLVSGAIQVNAKIPTDIPAGPAEVILRVGNEQSRAGVTVHVK